MTFLDLPKRTKKPRTQGLTSLLDSGVPTGHFEDVVKSHTSSIDFVKFGWGTSLVTKDIHRKIDVLQEVGISYFFGGTFFEKSVVQGKLKNFVAFCKMHRAQYVEISNGVIDLSNDQKCKYISELSSEFRIFSEVGYKDSERSLSLSPSRWIEYMCQDLESGAEKVITEARESGRSGICRPNGELRVGLISEILESDLDHEKIIFESPTKSLQCHFIMKVGPNVNLANIGFHDVVSLETLRLGLRGDTLLHFEQRRDL